MQTRKSESDKVIAVNLTGPFLCSQAAAKRMAEQSRVGFMLRRSGNGSAFATCRIAAKIWRGSWHAPDLKMYSALCWRNGAHGNYTMRSFNSMLGTWKDGEVVDGEQLHRGLPIQLERHGFELVELRQQT